MSASGIDVAGRHVASIGFAPDYRFGLQTVVAVSAIAMFKTANRRLLLAIDKQLARTIWFAA